MRFLYDGNLSPNLVELLVDIYPDSSHVYQCGLEESSDAEVWIYARENEFIIVTKDSDFQDMSTLKGNPPKVVWVRLGNSTTSQIEEMLRSNHEAIQQMTEDSDTGVLSLS